VKEYALYILQLLASKRTTPVGREYQIISLASSPTNHTPPPLPHYSAKTE